MKKFAYSFPILEDKINEWLEFAKEVNTTRKEEFSKMHKRIGVKKESWYLQKSNNTHEVVVYTEAETEHFMSYFKKDKSDFSTWFRKKVSEFQNLDLDTKTEMPLKVLDWEEKA